MDVSDVDEEEFGFSRNYFLAKESGSSIKKSNSKISDVGVINEQVPFSSDPIKCYLSPIRTFHSVLILPLFLWFRTENRSWWKQCPK